MIMKQLSEIGLRLRKMPLLAIKRCREPQTVIFEHQEVLPTLQLLEGRLISEPAMRAVLKSINLRIKERNDKVNSCRPKKSRLPPAVLQMTIPDGSGHGYVETEAGSVFVCFDVVDGVLDKIKKELTNTQTICVEHQS